MRTNNQRFNKHGGPEPGRFIANGVVGTPRAFEYVFIKAGYRLFRCLGELQRVYPYLVSWSRGAVLFSFSVSNLGDRISSQVCRRLEEVHRSYGCRFGNFNCLLYRHIDEKPAPVLFSPSLSSLGDRGGRGIVRSYSPQGTRCATYADCAIWPFASIPRGPTVLAHRSRSAGNHCCRGIVRTIDRGPLT